MATKEKAPEATFFCLDVKHPGATDLFDEARIFVGEDTDRAPVCPACQKQVSATKVDFDAKGKPVLPQQLAIVKERLAVVN